MTSDDRSSDESKENFVPRITQLDANEFDKEIHNVLTSQLLEISKYLNPGALNHVKPELNLILNLILFKYSIAGKNATFGQELLSVKYKDALSTKQEVGYALLNYILPYLKSKYDNNISRIQNERVRQIADKIEVFTKTCNVLNFLMFLKEGKYPTLTDRLLKLTYAPVQRLNRNVGYNYMTRELLWHGFTELLTFVLPLINYKTIKRKLCGVFMNTSHKVKIEKAVIYNSETKCVICDELPNMPCRISLYCQHLACYYCIKSNIMGDEKFMCPVCGEINTAHEQLQYLQG